MRKTSVFYFFKRRPIVRKDGHECWRGVANLLGLTTREGLRVEWMALYYTVRRENAVLGKGFISIDDFNLLRVCDHPDEVIDVVQSWYIKQEVTGRKSLFKS